MVRTKKGPEDTNIVPETSIRRFVEDKYIASITEGIRD